MKKLKDFDEVIKDYKLTTEEEIEMQLEMSIIKATIEARKKLNMTQSQLSEKSGIIQPSIAKIENYKRSPQATTLIKLLYPLGYTLKVVPIDEVNL